MEKTNWTAFCANQPWMGPEDVKLFAAFAMAAESEGVRSRRIVKYRSDVATAHKVTGRGLVQMVENLEALARVMAAINKSAYSWDTKKDVKMVLGQFFQFKHHNDRSLKYADKELRKITRHKADAKSKRVAKEVILREEVREMLDYCDVMEKALIFTLFESGTRVGEFEQMTRKHVHFIAEGAELLIPAGKTGERRSVVVEAATYLRNWMENYRNKSPDAPLWWSVEKRRRLQGPAIAKRLRMIVERMDAKRKKEGVPAFSKLVNPHNFRHSRATELGGEPGMTESVMDKIFGWELGSDMSATYLHLSDDQIKRAVLRTYGKVKEEQKAIITSKTCPKCHETNSLASHFCMRCGYDLDASKMPSKIEGMEEKMQQMQAQIDKLTNAAGRGTVAKAKKGTVD
ncbi:MAG: tyrosine-type recombinase/integrase [Candidatus Micrarchaeota archaeon]